MIAAVDDASMRSVSPRRKPSYHGGAAGTEPRGPVSPVLEEELRRRQSKQNAAPLQLSANAWPMLFVAWVVALVSSLGALFIGEVMGQAPCVLCWYQRAFMFPLAIVLAVACYRSDLDVWTYGLPLAVLGAAIAAYHTLLIAGVIPQALEPCGEGVSCTSEDNMVFRVVPLPLLSLAAFGAVAVLLLLSRKRPQT